MNANIIYTIFFFILPIQKSALLPLKIKMKKSTVSPTVLFFMPFSTHSRSSSPNNLTPIRPSGRIQTLSSRPHYLHVLSQQSHADPPIQADPVPLLSSPLPPRPLTTISRRSTRMGGSRPSPPGPTTSLAAARLPLRDAHGSIGKAGRKNQKKWRPFERLKSGAQHQISRHSEPGNHRISWRLMPVSVERPPFFLRFSPAFPPLPCASRKGGRAAARRPSTHTIDPSAAQTPADSVPLRGS